MGLPLLPPSPVGFPHPANALQEPDGLLAAGGALTSEWLVEAYSRGIFPWFDSDDDYILWWCPATRAVLVPGTMRVTRSLQKRIRNAGFNVTFDADFDAVIRACQAPRTYSENTWITPGMQAAYSDLHEQGLAHSVEVYLDDRLVGGLYGISLGRMFFGESMFSTEKDASKVAFFHLQDALQRLDFTLIDCQIVNPHLESMGVTAMPRDEFLQVLAQNDLSKTRAGKWSSLQ